MRSRWIGNRRPYNGVKTPTILQFSETECGVASLAILFSYFKHPVSVEMLREKCGISRDGCKAATLIKVAKEYGFSADSFRVELEELQKLTIPVIAFWKFNHFIVINGVGNKKVFINDPARGACTVSLEEFDKAFTGILIIIFPKKDLVKIKKNPIIFPLFREWISGFQKELFFIFMCCFVMIACPLFNSAISTIFIDYCIISHAVQWIPAIAIFSIIIAIIFTSITIIQRESQFKLCTKAGIIKSAEIISHTLRLPLIFYSLRQKSEIISLLTRAELIINLLFKSTTIFSMNLFIIIFCFIFMIKIDLFLSFSSLILSIFLSITFFVISTLNLSYEKNNIHSFSKLYGYTIASLRNIETIKACALEKQTFLKWLAFFSQKIATQDASNTVIVIFNTFNKSFHLLSLLTILFLGSYRISGGLISVGNLMSYYALQLFFCNSVIAFFQALKDIQTAYASRIRVNDMMGYEKDSRFLNNKKIHIDSYCPLISCKNVNFHYNKTLIPTLKNITLEIQTGQHIALVGETGSGKSTLAKILCGLYPFSSGEIRLFGKNIENFRSDELAKYFSFVPQDVSLFSGTIYQNITLWRQPISLSAIHHAIQDACIDELISRRGLQGIVEENGSNFSGGERQRIDIARALIQNSPILILDEATAALDVKTEMKLINHLRRRNKTIIYVAHRLSTIQHCDQVFIMKNGAIVERGHHADLVKARGYYYQLVQNEKTI